MARPQLPKRAPQPLPLSPAEAPAAPLTFQQPQPQPQPQPPIATAGRPWPPTAQPEFQPEPEAEQCTNLLQPKPFVPLFDIVQ